MINGLSNSTEAECPACDGQGEVATNESPTQYLADPSLLETEECSICEGTGSATFAQVSRWIHEGEDGRG